jgi:predicted ribosome quality control (RQC) complex YloA/Tae2 family protein
VACPEVTYYCGCPRGPTPDRATQECAAAIAAFHSKARTVGRVAVSCTEGRHVSKLPRAKAGTVTIRTERVLKVHPLTENTLATFRADSAERSEE